MVDVAGGAAAPLTPSTPKAGSSPALSVGVEKVVIDKATTREFGVLVAGQGDVPIERHGRDTLRALERTVGSLGSLTPTPNLVLRGRDDIGLVEYGFKGPESFGSAEAWHTWNASAVRITKGVEGCLVALVVPADFRVGALVFDFSVVVTAYTMFIKAGEDPPWSEARAFAELTGADETGHKQQILGFKADTFDLKGLNGERFKASSMLGLRMTEKEVHDALVWALAQPAGPLLQAAKNFDVFDDQAWLSSVGIAKYSRRDVNRDLYNFRFEPTKHICCGFDLYCAGIPIGQMDEGGLGRGLLDEQLFEGCDVVWRPSQRDLKEMGIVRLFGKVPIDRLGKAKAMRAKLMVNEEGKTRVHNYEVGNEESGVRTFRNVVWWDDEGQAKGERSPEKSEVDGGGVQEAKALFDLTTQEMRANLATLTERTMELSLELGKRDERAAEVEAKQNATMQEIAEATKGTQLQLAEMAKAQTQSVESQAQLNATLAAFVQLSHTNATSAERANRGITMSPSKAAAAAADGLADGDTELTWCAVRYLVGEVIPRKLHEYDAATIPLLQKLGCRVDGYNGWLAGFVLECYAHGFEFMPAALTPMVCEPYWQLGCGGGGHAGGEEPRGPHEAGLSERGGSAGGQRGGGGLAWVEVRRRERCVGMQFASSACRMRRF